MDYCEANRLAQRTDQAIWSSDWADLRFCGNKLERGRYYKEAWKALAAGVEGAAAMDRPVWQGPGNRCSHLLVLKRSRDLGDELRVIRFVGMVAPFADKVTALVEGRLIPLLKRSFPAVDFIDRDTPLEPLRFSHVAAQERLAYWFGHDDAAIQASFQPLMAPQTAEQPKGIGIAWYSRAIGKTLPTIQNWAHVLHDWPRQVQSLQYREDDAQFRTLSALAGRPIKNGRRMDQINNLDAFAKAIVKLQGVLTISNTTAHMAGALGVPCVVVLDNGIVTSWPHDSHTSPFYPHTRLIRREDQSWTEALHKGRDTLESLMQSR